MHYVLLLKAKLVAFLIFSNWFKISMPLIVRQILYSAIANQAYLYF